MISWPLMENNITRRDLSRAVSFLKTDPIMTQSRNVRLFEEEWSRWLGIKYSIFVNSGSSANFMTMALVKHMRGDGEILVPTLTWVSDIAAVLYHGLKPIFVDINPYNLGMAEQQVLQGITRKTKAIFITHILGFNALTDRIIRIAREKKILLIEDACESHGATFRGRKVGTLGDISNFSFYFAHHMSTVEGGMICTNDETLYQMARVLRSHGMLREATSASFRKHYEDQYPDLNPKFIFIYPSCNFRNTELNAVIGRSQLLRLDTNNRKRQTHFECFLDGLDSTRFRVNYELEGCVNYALILILKDPDLKLRDRITKRLDQNGIEYRRGTSGGGNQLRQPYLKPHIPARHYLKFPEVEHVHFFGYYIGNYPTLSRSKVKELCKLLNQV